MKLGGVLLSALFSVSSTCAKTARNRAPSCEVVKGITLSFYGKADIPDPIAYPECGRRSAGGQGTFESPLTMASAPGEFSKCEIVFVPYLLKYVRFEDVCTECVKDFAKDRLHMQIWTGTEISGGREQSQCERDLVPTHAMPIVRNPGPDYRIDSTPLYARGAMNACRLDHRYSLLNNDVFCYGRKGKPKKQTTDSLLQEQAPLDDEGWSLVEDDFDV